MLIPPLPTSFYSIWFDCFLTSLNFFHSLFLSLTPMNTHFFLILNWRQKPQIVVQVFLLKELSQRIVLSLYLSTGTPYCSLLILFQNKVYINIITQYKSKQWVKVSFFKSALDFTCSHQVWSEALQIIHLLNRFLWIFKLGKYNFQTSVLLFCII